MAVACRGGQWSAPLPSTPLGLTRPSQVLQWAAPLGPPGPGEGGRCRRCRPAGCWSLGPDCSTFYPSFELCSKRSRALETLPLWDEMEQPPADNETLFKVRLETCRGRSRTLPFRAFEARFWVAGSVSWPRSADDCMALVSGVSVASDSLRQPQTSVFSSIRTPRELGVSMPFPSGFVLEAVGCQAQTSPYQENRERRRRSSHPSANLQTPVYAPRHLNNKLNPLSPPRPETLVSREGARFIDPFLKTSSEVCHRSREA